MADPGAPVPAPGSLPSLSDAVGWTGHQVDDMGGSGVARVQAVFIDRESREPAWIVAKVGRFGKVIAIPFHDCAPSVDRIWVPYPRDTLRGAPGVDPAHPLTRGQEMTICEYYGIHDGLGRARELRERPEGAVTSQVATGAD